MVKADDRAGIGLNSTNLRARYWWSVSRLSFLKCFKMHHLLSHYHHTSSKSPWKPLTGLLKKPISHFIDQPIFHFIHQTVCNLQKDLAIAVTMRHSNRIWDKCGAEWLLYRQCEHISRRARSLICLYTFIICWKMNFNKTFVRISLVYKLFSQGDF